MHPDDAELPDDAKLIVSRFVRDGRLTTIPARRGKRRLVLDWLAQHFELGRRYPEAEVNAILGQYHDDVAALRRYLVDEEFLGRTADGVYWRVGGSWSLPDE